MANSPSGQLNRAVRISESVPSMSNNAYRTVSKRLIHDLTGHIIPENIHIARRLINQNHSGSSLALS